MDIFEHKKQFDNIVKKYNLNTEEQAKKIADFLTQDKTKITIDEFSKEFNIEEKEAEIFLKFIQKGVEFKQNIDKNNS
jgi:hypothetical protein